MEHVEFNYREHIGRLQKGCFLFAREELTDPNFSGTIILICEFSEDGCYGLVLNRFSHMPMSEIFNSISAEKDHLRKIHLGGPVQECELQILNITENPVKEAVKVASNVYLGGYWENIEEIVNTDLPSLHLFLGYSGWSKGQLEYEIALGGWEVLYGDIKEILTSGQEMWSLSLEEFKKKYCCLEGLSLN